MALIKEYTQEHLDAIVDIRKEIREAAKQIKRKPLAKAKGKAKQAEVKIEATDEGSATE